MPPLSRLALLFLAILCLHCLGNWELPLLDRDEPRFAEASREMVQRNDWIVPYSDGRPRYDKPPLIYWAQAASYRVFGENEFGARFPSALFAAATCVIIAIWGSRMDGLESGRSGFRAALMFGLCLQALIHGRSAVADMALVFFVTLAAWAGWEGLDMRTLRRNSGRTPIGFALIFWVALALGFLTKGPIALVPLGMVAFIAMRRRGATPPRTLEWVLGALLAVGIVAAWGVPALIRTHGEFAAIGLGRHVVERSFRPMEGHGAKSNLFWLLSTPFYLAGLFLSFFPWSIWLPAAIRDGWRQRKAVGLTAAYLLSGIVVVFVIFSVYRTKLPHYTLPAFPLLALLMSRWWELHRPQALFSRWTIGVSAATAAVTLVGFPLVSPQFASRQLYRRSEAWLDLTTELATTAEYQEPSVTWYFRGKLRTFQSPVKISNARAWMEQPGPRAIVLPEAREFEALQQEPVNWRRVEVSGFNLARGARVNLVLVYKPADRLLF